MLVITKENAEKELNNGFGPLHDSVLTRLQFFQEDKRLVLEIEKDSAAVVWNDNTREYESQDPMVKRLTIVFLNVIGYMMTACDYWGINSGIFDFEYTKDESEQLIIHRLYAIKDENKYEFSSLKERNAYIETKITFASGDTLVVACEKIEADY